MNVRMFHLVLRLDRWFHARFTPLGRLLLAALVAVGLFALNPRATLAWQLAILLVVVLTAATLWAPLFRPRLRARRLLPRFATVGTPLRYTLELENLGRRALTGLEVTDQVRRVRPNRALLRGVTPGGARARWFRGRLGYMGFVRALRLLEGARCHPQAVPALAPGARQRVALELDPVRRGYLQLDAVRIARADPTGVFRAQARLALKDRLLVLPQRYPVSWDGAGATLRRPRHGASRARSTGAGADFARLREYRPRDPLRHIHWRAWARLGEPVVKEFHEESPSRNALVLDTDASQAISRAAFEAAVSVASSFVADSGWRSGRLDLLFAGDTTVHLGQGSEGEGVGRMLEALACVERSGEQAFTALAEAVHARLPEFGACVLVLLDWDAPRQALVREVLSAQVAALVLLVGEEAEARLGAGLPAGLDPARIRAVPPGAVAQVLAGLARSAPRAGAPAPALAAVANA